MVLIVTHKFDAVILSVVHNKIKEINLRDFLKNDSGVVYDVKSFANRKQIDEILKKTFFADNHLK